MSIAIQEEVYIRNLEHIELFLSLLIKVDNIPLDFKAQQMHLSKIWVRHIILFLLQALS